MPVPQPLVPTKLRELLKNYPGHVARLQEVLTAAAEESENAPRFEYAIWALQGRFSTFGKEAGQALRAAQSAGDRELIASAQVKEKWMSQVAWKHVWLGDPALRSFFGTPREASE